MLAAAALAPAAFAAADRAPVLVLGAVLAGTVLLGSGIVTSRGLLVTAGLALVGAGYGATVVGGDLDMAASPAAGVLVLAAELAYWAVEPGARIPLGSRAAAVRFGAAAGIAVMGAAVSGLLLAAASRPIEGGAALGIGGFAALVVIAGVAALLLQSLRGSRGP